MADFLTIILTHINAFGFILFVGFFPGWLLSHALPIKHARILWSHALSMLVFSLLLWVCAQLSLPLSSIQPIIIITISALALCIVIFKQKDLFQLHEIKSSTFTNTIPTLIKTPIVLIGIAAISYLSLVGIYDLVPSDVLRHMERIQAANQDINHSQLNDFVFFNGISDNYHYYFYAYVMDFSNIDITSLTQFISVINLSLVLYAIFQFALHQNIELIQSSAIKTNLSLLFAMLCLIFFVLTKGIAGFSFIRYYSIGPTLLSYALFIQLIVQIDSYYKQGVNKRDLVLLTLGALFLLLWHMQELLFTLVYASLLLIYYCFFPQSAIRRPKLTLITFIVSVFITILIIQWQLPAPLEKTNRLISLSTLLHLFIPNSISLPAILQSSVILNPFIQFSQVLGLWGVLVYLCACFHLKLLLKKPLLICGLLIPFFTVLNPVFTDIFLRLRGEDTLYRLLYAVPLSVVAAYIIVHQYNAFSTNALNKKLIAMFSISVLILGLIPFHSQSLISQYSRINDVLPVPKGQSLRHWEDLSHELQKQPKKNNILTDPVTGYIITATSHSINRRYKFTSAQHININDLNLKSSYPFAKYKNQYLIINQRNGQKSDHGKLSQHWPDNILNIGNFYSQDVLRFISQHPHQFTRLWQKNGITLYLIK